MICKLPTEQISKKLLEAARAAGRMWAEQSQSGLDCTSFLVSQWKMFRSLRRSLLDLRLFLYRSEFTGFCFSLFLSQNT